jgi:hypothetical protein
MKEVDILPGLVEVKRIKPTLLYLNSNKLN